MRRSLWPVSGAASKSMAVIVMRSLQLVATTGLMLSLAGGVAAAGASSEAAAARGLGQAPALPYRSAILVDAASGTVLFEKDARRPAALASMTKMMLMLLLAEDVRDGRRRWDDPVRTSDWASRIGGSQVYLKTGEVFSLGEMMEAIAIHSANDAAVAVAEFAAGSTSAFVRRMNQRAQQLGMHDTVFHSVHGLPPDRGQKEDVSTARDMAALARPLTAFADIMGWTATPEARFRGGKMILTNTNRLVRGGWVDGLKTGSYRAAGFNVAATAQRDGLRLISIVLGAADKNRCFGEAERLLRRGFGEYRALVALKQGDVVASDVAVSGGRPRFVRVIAGGDVSVLARRDERRSFALELELPSVVRAPLSPHALVGEVIVKDGDLIVGRVPALAEDAVERVSFWERLF